MSRKLDKEIHEKIFKRKVKKVKYLGGYLITKGNKCIPEYEYAYTTDVEDAKGYLYQDFMGGNGCKFIIRVNEVPRYSSNLYDMELLIDGMRKKGWRILDITEDEKGKWVASFWYDDKRMSSCFGIGKSLSEALCRAALKTIKIKVGKRNVTKKVKKNKRTR